MDFDKETIYLLTYISSLYCLKDDEPSCLIF